MSKKSSTRHILKDRHIENGAISKNMLYTIIFLGACALFIFLADRLFDALIYGGGSLCERASHNACAA